MNNPEQDTPSFFKMVKSFTAASADFIAKGAPICTVEEYKDRLDTCNQCPFLIKKNKRCGKCGCLLEFKARMKTQHCPEKKWEGDK
jgi:hypothetical protein|tara:strand:- start:1345 stop:1602 length:258 start_codon:yes stop_codon:yes gene_type:complete